MGGGIVSKDKFISENGRPVSFFRMSGDAKPNLFCDLSQNKFNNQSLNWICGGGFLPYQSSLNYLAEFENVGMIVTLTIEPIKSGRNINHVPYDYEWTEWVDGDFDLEETLNRFQILHVPIADTGFLTEENANKLLDGVQKYHEDNPTKSVYFHCWAGQGRTSLVISYILMKMYGEDYESASAKVKRYNLACKMSGCQIEFLRGDNNLISSSDRKLYSPIIKTPFDHQCYDIKNARLNL